MKGFLSFLRTAGVFVALWAVLAVIGFVLGVLPIGGAPTAEASLDGGDAEVADALTSDGGTEIAPPIDGVDGGAAGSESSAATSMPVGPALLRRAVCPEPAAAPSLAALDIVGDARLEIVVGCGDRWEVLALRAGAALEPMRVARIEAPPSAAGLSPFAAAPAVGDVDGDGSADVVFPFVRFGAGGSTDGGGLYLVRRSMLSPLGDAAALAPISASAVALGAIDSASGLDLVAVHELNPFARLSSEGWVFRGGASPRRSAVLRAGTGARDVALADVDRDGFLDAVLASTDDGRVDVFFGDGAGIFPRSRTLTVPSAAHLAIGDVDDDGAPDVVVEAAVPTLVLSRSGADPSATPLVGAPALRDLVALDLDGDGRAELVGWEPSRLVALALTVTPTGVTFETRTLLELALGDSLGVRRSVVADVDGDGVRDVILLGAGDVVGVRTLELVIVPGVDRGTFRTAAGPQVEDAPLVLGGALPEATTR